MKNQCWKKGIAFAAIGAILFAGADTASAKTGKVELNLTGTSVQNRRPQALEKAKKVTIKCSKPSVVKVKYRKNRKDKRIYWEEKGNGSGNGKMPSEKQKEKILPVQGQGSQRKESV